MLESADRGVDTIHIAATVVRHGSARHADWVERPMFKRSINCQRDRMRVHRRAVSVAALAMACAACGGSTDSSAVPASPADEAPVGDVGADGTGPLDIGDEGGEGESPTLDDPEFDELTQDVLDDLADKEEEFAGSSWEGVRLVTSYGAVETLDPGSYTGAAESFRVDLPTGLGSSSDDRILSTAVITPDWMWVSGGEALYRVDLTGTGALTTTIAVEDVYPGGEFGAITGDANGIYVIAVDGGVSEVVELDPTTGEVRTRFASLSDATPLLSVSSDANFVAASHRDGSGIGVILIDRATGSVAEIGDFSTTNQAFMVRGELWVVLDSGKTTVPNTYQKYSTTDGSLIGEGTLPGNQSIGVFGDRVLHFNAQNGDRENPEDSAIEVEPLGTPVEALIPPGFTNVTAIAEIDGLLIVSGCCIQDEASEIFAKTVVVDPSSGELLDFIDSVSADAIFPAR